MDYYMRSDDERGVRVISERFAEDMELYKAKFRKEAKIIASLKHNNIISIIDVFDDNDTTYYAMEYIDGFSLRDYVDSNGRMSETQAVRYIRQASKALSYIHANDRTHLDIKPANIMVHRGDDSVVVIDFGLSKHFKDDGTPTSTTPGGLSRGYTPLEMYQTQKERRFLPATDIYSLGATLYTLLTGELPPEATDVALMGDLSLPSHISPTVANAIKHAMYPNPNERLQSVDAFVAMLDSVVVAKAVEGRDTIPTRIEHPAPKESKSEVKMKAEHRFSTERQKHNYNQVCRAMKSHIDEAMRSGIIIGMDKSHRVITTIYIAGHKAFEITSANSQIGKVKVLSNNGVINSIVTQRLSLGEATLRPGDELLFGSNTNEIVEQIYSIVANVAHDVEYETRYAMPRTRAFFINTFIMLLCICGVVVIYILLHETFRTRYVDEYGWWCYDYNYDKIEGGTAVAGIIAFILFLIVRKNNINGKRVDGNR